MSKIVVVTLPNTNKKLSGDIITFVEDDHSFSEIEQDSILNGVWSIITVTGMNKNELREFLVLNTPGFYKVYPTGTPDEWTLTKPNNEQDANFVIVWDDKKEYKEVVNMPKLVWNVSKAKTKDIEDLADESISVQDKQDIILSFIEFKAAEDPANQNKLDVV